MNSMKAVVVTARESKIHCVGTLFALLVISRRHRVVLAEKKTSPRQISKEIKRVRREDGGSWQDANGLGSKNLE